jgi:hypothetical protein
LSNELEEMWKEAVVTRSWYYPRVLLEELNKTRKTSVKISLVPGVDSNSEPPKCRRSTGLLSGVWRHVFLYLPTNLYSVTCLKTIAFVFTTLWESQFSFYRSIWEISSSNVCSFTGYRERSFCVFIQKLQKIPGWNIQVRKEFLLYPYILITQRTSSYTYWR